MTTDILRPLSKIEEYLQTTVVSKYRIRGNLPSSVVYTALEYLSKRHPFLSCRISKIKNELYFLKNLKFKIPLFIEYAKSDEDINALYKRELNTPLNNSICLWRVTLIYNENENKLTNKSIVVLIVTMSHCIVDGTSLINFIKEILEYSIKVKKNDPLLKQIDILPLLPPPDHFIIEYVKNSSQDSESDISVKPKYVENKIYKINPNFSLEMNKKNVKAEYLKDFFKRKDTLKIINYSKKIKKSIHSILCASVLIAIRKKLKINSVDSYNIMCLSAMDLRRHIAYKIKLENLCNFVSGIKTIHSINYNTQVKELATDIQNKIKFEIESGNAFNFLFSPPSPSKNIIVNREWAVLVSNLGIIQIPEQYGNLNLLETDFTGAGIPSYILLSFITYKKILSYLFLFSDPWFTIDLIRDINKIFRQNIYKII